MCNTGFFFKEVHHGFPFLLAVFINSRFSLVRTGRDWDIMKREEEGRKEGRKRPTKKA